MYRTTLVVLLTTCMAVRGAEIAGFDIHGFAGGGYLVSDHNNYMTAKTADGTFQFYDVGINLGRNLLPDVRVGAQVVMRRVGEMGKDDIRFDWANIDYRPYDFVGLRVGVVKVPVGLYNESRDLDILRSTVFLPQSVYNEQLAEFFVGNRGGQLYGRIDANQFGAFNYTLTLAQMRIGSDSPWAVYFADNVLLNMGLLQGQPDLYPLDSFDMENNYHAGGALVWDTPLYGLRASVTFNRLDADAVLRTGNPQLPEFDAEISLKRYVCLSLEYRGATWGAVAEYMNARFDTRILLPGVDDAVVRESEGYYFMVNRRIGDRVDVFAYHSIYYPNTKDRSGRNFDIVAAATGRGDLYPAALGWQKDTCVGVRFDVNENWIVKAEYHYIDGVGQLYPADNPDGFTRCWNFYAFKVSYAF